MRQVLFALSLLTTVTLGCGSSVVAEEGSGGSGAGSSSSSASGGQTPCPVQPPGSGATCSGLEGRTCEYGNDPRIYCRGYFMCVPTGSGEPHWQDAGNPDCPPPPVGDCPPTPTVTGECQPDGLICIYSEGAQCACSACTGGPCGQTPYWACSLPPPTYCPGQAPNSGQACSEADEGVVCDYGSCSGGTVAKRICQDGVWVDEPVPCPV